MIETIPVWANSLSPNEHMPNSTSLKIHILFKSILILNKTQVISFAIKHLILLFKEGLGDTERVLETMNGS